MKPENYSSYMNLYRLPFSDIWTECYWSGMAFIYEIEYTPSIVIREHDRHIDFWLDLRDNDKMILTNYNWTGNPNTAGNRNDLVLLEIILFDYSDFY